MTGVSGQNTYNLQFAWSAFVGTINTDVITVTATAQDGSTLTESYNFMVAGTVPLSEMLAAFAA